jgi:uncharacterized protein (DUF849 family)
VLSIISGGGIRIGLEDNLWYDDERQRLATNYSLVKRILEIAGSCGYRPYNGKEARQILIG